MTSIANVQTSEEVFNGCEKKCKPPSGVIELLITVEWVIIIYFTYFALFTDPIYILVMNVVLDVSCSSNNNNECNATGHG
jgi:capsule polysaccharide export protein KpsE/RkpR